MYRRILKGVFVLLLLCLVSNGYAGPHSDKRFRHADKNRDGSLDEKEIRMEERWELKHHKQVKNWWEERADINEDGKVDPSELDAWERLEKERLDLNKDGVIDAKERRLCWRHARSRVNTPLEEKYDKNQDGWLEPDEIREMLKDKHALIKSNGKAKVDTDVEAEYDTNKDGVLDQKEAKDLQEDLK